ncbi:MAG: sugar-binding protein [Candidatus Saccharibacteria bacterium]
MKRIFTLLLCAVAGTMAFAQDAPTGVFAKASVAPVMDGVVDAVWAEATPYNIDKSVGTETPTIGASGESTWQGLWTMDGVYVLLNIADNDFFPNYAPGGGANNWEYDKPEIYFDVNTDNLSDGGAPGSADAVKPGHYQFAPGFTDLKNNGTPITDSGNGVVHAFKVDGSHYICEYFIPITILKDKNNVIVDKTATIGFDVIFIDRDHGDAARNQAVWSNTGANYSNMDGAGRVTFADAEQDVYIDDIKLTGGTITTNKGTLQIGATITPANATYKTLIWSVENKTGKATIDANGVLTALTNGTVTVTAKSTDVQAMEATIDVEISGQAISRNDIWNNFNLIKNWSFENVDATTASGLANWGGWLDGAGQEKAVQEEGAAVMSTVVGTNGEQYHYQFSQDKLQAMPNVPYVVTFKSWANAERANTLDFEDTSGNGYNRYGASTDAEAQGGRSEWHYTLTTEPQWFTFHVTFDQIKDNTNQKIQWLQSQAEGTIYLDSVLLVTQEEYDLLQTLPSTTGVTAKANSITNVYPSPVTNTLYVDLKTTNSKVAIFNALGQKLMEKTAYGNKVTFDVSSLRKGLYFVKLEDGTTKKFVK